MQSLTDHVYIENQYAGVTLGAIVLPNGLIHIDAPLLTEDSRLWRAALLGRGAGPERLLILLDAHPDRALGTRAMESTLIAHEKATQTLRGRPPTYKAQNLETGAEWETLSLPGSTRWLPPEISFSQQMAIEWNNSTILLEHHPGPHPAAIWVILPQEKIVFVGDAVMKNQPPFLAQADLPAWFSDLELLRSPAYRDYIIVGGRDGTIGATALQNFVDYLQQIYDRLEKLASKGAPAEKTEDLIPSLLEPLRFAAARQEQYTQRLRYGLYQYYNRNYANSQK
ncbi:MAG: MBL fold metallo-hydrolase [Anaerolineae bacterium]|nr:MAG: MBL fold metallo-hydrolase [Anaerolineae bacterium]